MNNRRKIKHTHSRAPSKMKASEVDDADGRDGLSQNSFVPRTPLGRRLWTIRRRILASGQPLLDWQDIENEVRDRRGEAIKEPTN